MAKKQPETALYFTTVVILEKGLAVLGGHLYQEGYEPTITRPTVCNNGSWGCLDDMDDVVCAATKKPNPTPNKRPTLCLLGRMGNYRETITKIPHVDTKIKIPYAYLNDLRYIGKHLYACGTQNQIHKQVGKKWERMDEGIFSPLKKQVDRCLNAIDGFSDNDIYAVGDQGVLNWDGKKWTKLKMPTDFPFYCVLCASNGEVYVGGSGGVLLKGNASKGWIDLSNTSVTNEVFEDMAEFQGKIYITATDELISTNGKTIEKVNVPVKGHKAYYAIDAVPDELWTVGDDCVLQFDGKTWTRHVCPDNV
jgi:hypothetical protein